MTKGREKKSQIQIRIFSSWCNQIISIGNMQGVMPLYEGNCLLVLVLYLSALRRGAILCEFLLKINKISIFGSWMNFINNSSILMVD